MNETTLAQYKSDHGNELLVTTYDGCDYGHFEARSATGAGVRVMASSAMLVDIAAAVNKHSPPEPTTIDEKWSALHGAELNPLVYPSGGEWAGTLDHSSKYLGYRIECPSPDGTIEGLYRQAKESGWLR